MKEPPTRQIQGDPGACAVLTTEQMYAADQMAEAGGVPGLTLMENAGRAVAEAIRARWQPRPVAVLCGPGNNGGDGFVVARLLAEAGWDVGVALLGKRDALKGDAAAMAARWTGAIGDLTRDCLEGRSLAVDAVFGAGLTRAVTGAVAETLREIAARRIDCVAVDTPSGVQGDSGQILGVAPTAQLTVTFFRKKPGHLLAPGRFHCGETIVADIGIPESVLAEIRPALYENRPGLWLDRFPRPDPGTHKYKRGHAIVLCGGPSKTGAARLAARGALRSGAGLVTVLGPPDALEVNAASLTAIMVGAFDGVQDLAAQLADARRNVVLIGPGNGVGEATRANVLTALRLGKHCVLDADALTSFEGRADELFAALTPKCILTPHEGEFARLFGAIDAPDKVSQTLEAAKRAGATVLLKGPDTVIASPDSRAAINADAPPTLATAGSGDVLAGFCLGLIAQGMPGFEAASAAAWLHGAAATAFGPGLIAEDLPETLPKVLRDLGV
jgi:ADP-dependent NAD(P)H-hydrate dehydratase / NAD(P)H-hydrate epimerase